MRIILFLNAALYLNVINILFNLFVFYFNMIKKKKERIE